MSQTFEIRSERQSGAGSGQPFYRIWKTGRPSWSDSVLKRSLQKRWRVSTLSGYLNALSGGPTADGREDQGMAVALFKP
jgi:hypothetical protein